MTTQAFERKYSLIKVSSGDYLLPSNDAGTIWRIARYTDGPSNGLEIPRDREFWGVWRYYRPLDESGFGGEELEWDRWTHEAAHCATRAEAVAEALRMS